MLWAHSRESGTHAVASCFARRKGSWAVVDDDFSCGHRTHRHAYALGAVPRDVDLDPISQNAFGDNEI